VAAPLFAKVSAAQLARLGLYGTPAETPPTAVAAAPPPVAAPPVDDSIRAAEETEVVLTRDGDRVLVPDFRGLTTAQVRRAVSGSEVQVELIGDGRAVAQEPDPGTILAGRATRVRVRFAPDA
jgi:hypothetical protein